MKKNSVVANYILNTIYQVLIIIVPLITTPYVSRVLGAEGIGKYSYTYSIISYLLIFAAMGTTTYGQRTIAYFQDDLYKRSVKVAIHTMAAFWYGYRVLNVPFYKRIWVLKPLVAALIPKWIMEKYHRIRLDKV